MTHRAIIVWDEKDDAGDGGFCEEVVEGNSVIDVLDQLRNHPVVKTGPTTIVITNNDH